jgi:hypothetical protein
MDPGPASDPDPAIFVIDLQDANKKLIFLSRVFLLITYRYLFAGTFTSFFKEKKFKGAQV